MINFCSPLDHIGSFLFRLGISHLNSSGSGHCHAQAQALGPGRVHFVWWIYQLKWQFLWGKWWRTMFFCSTPFLKYELSRWTVFYTCSIEFYHQRPEVKKCLWPKGSACCHMDMKVELFWTFWLLKFVKVMKGHRERQPVGHQGRRLWSWQQRRIWRRGWWGPSRVPRGINVDWDVWECLGSFYFCICFWAATHGFQWTHKTTKVCLKSTPNSNGLYIIIYIIGLSSLSPTVSYFK